MEDTTSYTKESEYYSAATTTDLGEFSVTSCIEAVVPLTPEIKVRINELIPILTFKKGEFILRSGDVSVKNYGILKGCIRKYYEVDGDEKTTFFYTEDQSILASSPKDNGERVRYNLVCVEDCVLTMATEECIQELLILVPELEKLRFMSYQDEMAQYQEMLDTYITSSPEERYLRIINDRPELLNRVPQYQLASYLGVKPESLSRIRKRIVTKK